MLLPPENKRIKDVIEYVSNGNILSFSRDIGISQPRIARLFSIDKRNNKYPLVSFEIVQSIINKFININAEWLLTGNGIMLKKQNIQKKRQFESVAKSVAKNVENEIYKKSDSLKGNDTSPPLSDQSEIIYLLKETKQLLSDKNYLLSKENTRLEQLVHELKVSNIKLSKENKSLILQITNLEAESKELKVLLKTTQNQTESLKKELQKVSSG